MIWPMLWFHNPEEPIGKVIDAQEDEKGLLITAQLDISMTGNEFNNPKAAMVFSGFKSSYISEFSMGYIAIQKDYDKQGVRNLKECAIVEASACTALFAANPESIVTGVKSVTYQKKSVCGDTSLPIGPRDASWDGAAAHNQIVTWATKDDGSIDPAKMKQVHLQCDGEEDKITSYGYAFCDIKDNKPVINVGGVKACAGVLSGARGADPGDDLAGMQKKVEELYANINKKYPKDTPLVAPWKDDGKRRNMNPQTKTLLDHFNEEQAEDLVKDWQDVYICALTAAIFDAFTIGDQPEQDISEALDAFKELVLSKFVAQAIECGLSQYLSDNDYSYNPAEETLHNGSSDYGWMSRSKRPDGKVGATISKATQGTLEAHQEEMKASLNAIGDHVKTMQQKVSDLTQLWHEEGQGDPYGNDDDSNDGKSRLKRREPPTPALSRQGLQPLRKSTVEDDAITEFINFLS
jgi:HK97 family phage prohead protease